MSNLIPLEKAAAMLGVSVDRLTEMRSNNELFGYRDGSSWKFKLQELQRVADELGITLKKSIAGGEESDDFELSDSSSGNDPLILDESEDLVLDDSSESGDVVRSERKVTDDADEIKFGDSSLDLAAESSKKLRGGAGGKKAGGSSKKMLTGEDEDDELRLADEGLMEDDLLEAKDDSSELSSDFEDSELVLDDSDSEAEMPMNEKKKKSDSKRDFALSDEALELGGSDIDSLELSDDGEMISLAESADADAATMMQEDDFNLTPIEGGEGEESSGSQVIALEDSDLFSEESAETQLAAGQPQQQPALLPDTGLEHVPGSAVATSGQVVTVAVPSEPPFSMGQVLAMGVAALVLVVGGMVAYDLARNLWMPDDAITNSGVMKVILTLTGMDQP